ncbi:MAG: T9SS type A sorting domain-containing protein [Bacteroidetes bacterium]|nr:T9SS type A sorting domain-containing protein [Bacteroidota bacterium]
MKKLLLTFCLLLSVFLCAQGTWYQKANLGITTDARSQAAGFELNGYGYIGTGYNGTQKNDFWKYDPVANTWTQIVNFPGTARSGATGFSVNGYGYMGLGFDGAGPYVNDFYKYDPAGNSWTPVANFPGTARELAAAFVIGSYAYVGTGTDGTNTYTDFYQYDPVGDAWTTKTSFTGTARCGATGFAVSGMGYFALGKNATSSTYYNTMYQYNPTGNSWTAKTSYTGAARAGASAFVINSFGYVGTGESANNATLYNNFYKYDPAGNSWSAIANFIGFPASYTNGFAIGNYGYCGMGYASGSQVNTWYMYDLCSLSATITPTSPSCNGGSNGSAFVTTSNGTSPFTYSWNTGGTTSAISTIAAGNYTVTVNDAGGCSKTATVTVTQPTALVGTVTTITNASCNSMCNGKINVSASGATPPYTYVWTPSVSSTTTATGLCAGTYTIKISDSKGCSNTNTATVTQPTALTASLTSANASNVCTCDGSASISPSGGTPAYTYAWSPGGKTTSAVTGLCGGTTYSITVTDSKGCSLTNTVSILPAPMNVSTTCISVSCNGLCDGSTAVTITGGNSPYTYSWSNGATTSSVSGLCAATYSLTITDADGCTKQTTCTINSPATLQVFSTNTSAVTTACSCNGSMSANVIGGTTPYTYLWSNGCTKSACTGLCSAGQYSVQVTDASGCTAIKSPITVNGSAQFKIDSMTSYPATCSSCPNGSATVYVTTGMPTYTYAWSPGGATTQTATGLVPGTYTICVTDANNCKKCDTITVQNATGINAMSENNLLRVYPVPAKSQLFIELALPSPSSGEIRMYDMFGKEVYRSVSSSVAHSSIDVSSLGEGLYELRITTGEMTVTKKIILSR